MPAFSHEVNIIKNPDSGPVSYMGMVGYSPPTFEEKVKQPFHMRTKFALETVFDDMGFSGGANIFKMEAEQLIKNLMFTEGEPPLDGEEEAQPYKLGKDIFLMPNVVSTVENPQ